MTGMLLELEGLKERLLTGEFGGLEESIAALEANLPALSALSAAELATIRAAAESNARCLDAALRGLRSARRRIETLAAAERGETYDASGRRHGLPAADPGRRV